MCTLPLSAWIHRDHRANKRAIHGRSNNTVDGGRYDFKEVSTHRTALSHSPGDKHTNFYIYNVD